MRLGLLVLGLLMAAPGLPAEGEAAPAAAAAPASRAEMKEQLKGTRQQLRDMQGRIKKAKKDKRKVERQERNLVGELVKLNRVLDTAQREKQVNVKNLGLVEDRLRSVRSQLDLLQAEEVADRDALGQDLARLYKARNRQGASLLFSAHSPAELAARARYLEELSTATRRQVRSLRESIQRMDGYRREYDDRQQEFKHRQEDAEASRQRAQREYLRKQALLKDVRVHKALAVNSEHELEASAKRLESGLDALARSIQQAADRQRRQALEDARQVRAQPRPAPGHERERPSPHISTVGSRGGLRPGMPWPVAGRIVSRYGKQVHPIFHVPVFNRGIEIAAAYGSGVRAVAAGMVVHASEMEGFGQLVVLDHGAGMMSVYGYGSQVHVAEGQRVEQGDLLEDVGEAGASSQPALYFEIRQGAKALDPMRYLRRHG